MARIPEEEIERIKQDVSLERLVEASGVELKKTGKDLFGRCPFHADETASLSVTPAKNLWNCLGACQGGGDVFAWVMKRNGVSFRHAYELLREGLSSIAASPVKRSTVRALPMPVSLDADDQGLKNQVPLVYYHADHLNTPRLVANASGTPVWRWDQQEPFGVSAPDENPSGLGVFEQPLRFPGQYADKETNLYYNYFRDYDSASGRYPQSDPIGLEGGLNTYAYADGSPIARFDRFGLMGSGGGGAVTYPPKQPQEECPCPDPITITTTSSVCQPGDDLCAQAMKAAGIQGPYFGGTKTYSLPCLIKFGIGVSGGKFAAGTVAVNQAPKVAAQMGLSASNVAKVAKAAAVMNSPPVMLIGGTVTIATILKQCECPTQ